MRVVAAIGPAFPGGRGARETVVRIDLPLELRRYLLVTLKSWALLDHSLDRIDLGNPAVVIDPDDGYRNKGNLRLKDDRINADVL